MRNLLIDLSAIKTGGGAQRALNFINVLSSIDSIDYNIFVLRPKGYFREISKGASFLDTIETPVNFIARYVFENLLLQTKLRKLNIDVVLTFAGTGIPLPPKITSLVGVAYPIICYDDSPYWEYLGKKDLVKQKVKNYFRKRRLRRATVIFAQTVVMRERLSRVLDKKVDKIEILPPSPSMFVTKAKKSEERVILLLSGNDHHKNLWRLYDIALALEEREFDCRFVITVNKNEWISSLSRSSIDSRLIDKFFDFRGKVNSTEIQELYDEAALLLQLSDLESFSNNYMEAWKAEVPLIVSERDFAIEVCRDAALYVDPHNPNDVADKIIKLTNDKTLQHSIVSKGTELLSELPSQNEYFRKLISMLDEL